MVWAEFTSAWIVPVAPVAHLCVSFYYRLVSYFLLALQLKEIRRVCASQIRHDWLAFKLFDSRKIIATLGNKFLMLGRNETKLFQTQAVQQLNLCIRLVKMLNVRSNSLSNLVVL